MANPSHEKGNVAELLRIGGVMANVMYNLAQRPGDPVTDRDVAVMDGLRREWDAARRATPPSPSTAPDGKLRPRYKADGNRVVREHGGLLAQTYIPAEAVYIANALNEQAERMSSRPAEVDDEGLPALPFPFKRLIGEGIAGYSDVYTAEQYRQGQRDAVAADRARREKGGA